MHTHTNTHLRGQNFHEIRQAIFVWSLSNRMHAKEGNVYKQAQWSAHIYIMHSCLLPLGSINCYVIVLEIEWDHYHYLNCPSLILLHIMEIPCYLHRPICNPSDNTPIGDWRSMVPFKSIWGGSFPLWLFSFSAIVRKGIKKTVFSGHILQLH